MDSYIIEIVTAYSQVGIFVNVLHYINIPKVGFALRFVSSLRIRRMNECRGII